MLYTGLMSHAKATKALSRITPFKPIIKQVGPCTLAQEKREPYEALVRAIAHQQVHGNAARAMINRLLALHEPGGFPPAEFILALPAEALRGCGFSASKQAAIRDIALKTSEGLVPTRRAAARMSDDALIERLVQIRGVGRWTVEMLLMFTLGRMDVLPVDDFGVREGYRLAMGLDAQPKPRELAAIGADWAPHRTVASWYLWRRADMNKAIKNSAG